MMIKYIIGTIGLCMASFLIVPQAQAIPTIVYDAGQITGVSGLEFGDGTVWDMAVYDGSFSDFSNTVTPLGIPDVYDPLFASQASDVLFNYFASLDDVPDPWMFIGCDTEECSINTVYAAGISGGVIMDIVSSETVVVGLDSLDRTLSSGLINGDWDYETYASWQLTSSVPEPSMFLLLGSGVLLFGVARRKKA